MKNFNYELDKVTGFRRPNLYPSKERSDDWSLPDEIRNDFGKLNTVIETKYVREFLKICAFYNKMFPSLKTANWTRTTYNVPPFTAMDQERADTGTGISQNYLKQITDQVVSRLGTVTYEGMLIDDVPTFEFVVYKDEVERLFRKHMRNEDQNHMSLEVFHDAAILGYSHVFIDPYTHKDVKANDYEIGLYESQFNRDAVRQMLYRDYAFPIVDLVPYLADQDKETREKIIEEYGTKVTCDFKMYFDCPNHKVHVTIGGTTLKAKEYPFDTVQMDTFRWDVGFTKVMSTSLFDLLYPIQRELNRTNAKLQQMIRMYKGAVPVFNSDVDIAMKAITNGSGEALYVSSARPIDSLMTVINPTPLDSQLDATITARKTEMYELAGLQQATFDMENMRSAAAVIAVDQMHDMVFQSQMAGRARFLQKRFRTRVNYNAKINPPGWDSPAVNWNDVKKLIDAAVIELKPVQVNAVLGNKSKAEGAQPIDYALIHISRTVMKIMKGLVTYDTLGFIIDKESVKAALAATMLKFEAMDITIPDTAYQFMIRSFVEDIKKGVVNLRFDPENATPEAGGAPSGT